MITPEHSTGAMFLAEEAGCDLRLSGLTRTLDVRKSVFGTS